MNNKSQQLTADKSLHIAKDQPLSQKEIFEQVRNCLGESCSLTKIDGRQVIVYSSNDKTSILLSKSITYLGNPHPLFKKRIQLSDWYQDFSIRHPEMDVRFIGVYHYDDNIVFVDFCKETYLTHGLHNSSAHVYINDLFQGMTLGTFRKTDKFGNDLFVVRFDKFKEYMDGGIGKEKNLFELFRNFNCGYPFGEWLYALDIIKEMHENEWQHWRQTEWAGWFLEYKFNKFVKENHTERQMKYIGDDFDIRFEEDDFYGDLKASDIEKVGTIGNDQNTLIEHLYRYDKFWYIIYEHQTIKDDAKGYEATKGRNRYIKSIDPSYKKGEMSYHQRMKHSVKFIKMTIVELNRINYGEALRTFHQGHQANGAARNPKFIIDKKVLEDDNFVVFRYTYQH